MNIAEVKLAANEGNIDRIYELINQTTPTDSEREQLQSIALNHIDKNPEVAVAASFGTSEEFGRKIYEMLLMKNQIAALKEMKEREIPGSDTPLGDDLVLIAEHCSTEVWDWAVEEDSFMNQIGSIAYEIGAAAVIAAEKNPELYAKLKGAHWTWEKPDGEGSGGVGELAAIHSDPEVFRKIIQLYQPYLGYCAVAAAENGRRDNLEVLADSGYDLKSYPIDPDNGTLADIAAVNDQTETLEWLVAQGVHRDF
jgi:hypothetical protein